MNIFQKQLLIDKVPLGIISKNTQNIVTTQPKQNIPVEEFEKTMKTIQNSKVNKL